MIDYKIIFLWLLLSLVIATVIMFLIGLSREIKARQTPSGKSMLFVETAGKTREQIALTLLEMLESKTLNHGAAQYHNGRLEVFVYNPNQIKKEEK